MITDLMSHVIDMLARKVISNGGSCVGVCSTPEMKNFLYTRAFNVAKVTPGEWLLYDQRFTSESTQAGIVGNLNHAHP